MFYKLESLRGVAACLVVLIHSAYNFGDTSIAFIKNSYLFVDFFFILSGFLMSYAYGEKINLGLNFFSYVILRLGRIYPLHIFVLFVWLPYLLIKQYLYSSGLGGVEQFDKNTIYTFTSNIFLMHSMGLHSSLSWNFPSWSISTEFFAYIAFYLLTISVDKAKNMFVPSVVIIGCYTLLHQLNRHDLDITYDFGAIRCLGAFYLGVLTFRLKVYFANIKLKFLSINVFEVMIVSFVILVVTMSGEHYLYLYCCLIAFACSILIFSNSQSGLLGHFLTLKLSRNIGKWSYSIYLLHAIVLGGISNVLEYVFNISPNEPQGILSLVINTLVLLVTITLSKYSYKYIEKIYKDKVKLKLNKYYQRKQRTFY